MVRKSAAILISSILATLLLAGCGWCDTAGNKAKMLLRLTQSGRTQIPARAVELANNNPRETAQLALDLVFHNWASRISHMPAEVNNIDAMIPALVKALDDQTVEWAARYYSPNQDSKNEAPIPARDDERVQSLFDLKTQFKSAIDYRESSPIKAADALQSAAKSCQNLYLDISEALVLKQLGDLYLYEMSRYPLAEACYERAAWTFAAYRCRASSATVYDDWGTLSTETDRYTNATEHFTESAQQWEQLARQDPSRYKYRDLAGREYIKAGEAQMAAGDVAAAAELMRVKGLGQLQQWAAATKSYDLLIRNLVKVADFRRVTGDAKDSLELLKQAQRACERQFNPLLTAKVLDEMAKTYGALSQAANKSAALDKRTRLLNETGRAGEAALSRLFKETSLPPDARTELRASAERGARAFQELTNYPRSAELWKKTSASYQAAGLPDAQIRCLRSLGAVLDAQQKPQESLEVRREAVMIARKAKSNALAADIVQDMVQAFISADDFANALEGFTELTPIIEEAGNIRGAARVLEARGALLASRGQYAEAIADFQNAGMRYLSQVGDLWAAAKVSLELSSAQNAAGKPDDARATLETAVEDIESRNSQDVTDDRGGVVKSLYRELIKRYVHSGNVDSAANLVRKAKPYPWLAQLVIEIRNDNTDAAAAEWAKKLDIAVADGTWKQPSAMSRNAVETWSATAEWCWWLERQHTREYRALPVDPLELVKSRARIPENMLVVEYLPTPASMYCFVIGRDRCVCRRVGMQAASVDALMSLLRRKLKSCEESMSAGMIIPAMTDWQESWFLEIKEPLVTLYAQLIKPIEGDLAGKQKLAFALPDEFAGLPMHALISGEQDSVPSFMIQDYEISYLARGMLDDLTDDTCRAIEPTTDWLAIFADPEGNLPGAQKEATNIKNAYISSRWYVGKERATTTNFISECKQAGILHIAAHHRIDPNPAAFQLLLAADKGSDGSIGIHELSGVENPSLQLVALSACDSIGSSDPISSGPARAAEVFSLIGARSVLGGLWKVSDEASSRVMGDFYRALNRGKSRTEALQLALVTVIESKQFAHPFYWACFALYGNPR